MIKRSHILPGDLHGVSRMVVDGVVGMTHVVESLHLNIMNTPGILDEPLAGQTKGITGTVYRSIRGVTGFIGGALDLILAPLARVAVDLESTSQREAILSALNGVLGDHLEQSQNPLAINMQFRKAGRMLALDKDSLVSAFPEARSRLIVFVHGLCMNDLQWSGYTQDAGGGENPEATLKVSYPSVLETKLNASTIFLYYNSGRHISSNGRQFAEIMESLTANWPVSIESIAVIGHSMGGLLARSAYYYAEQSEMSWRSKIRQLVFLGTPHHGAPLERGGNWIDFILGASPYTAAFAKLGKIRSAGITDLRFGNIVDEDWNETDRFERGQDRRHAIPLPGQVSCFAIAGSTGKKRGVLREQLVGDGLVRINSALGIHPDAALCLQFAESRQAIFYGKSHFDLLNDAAVLDQIIAWLSDANTLIHDAHT